MRPPIVVLRSNDYCFLGAVRGCRAAGSAVQLVTFDWDGAGPWYSESSRHFDAPEVIENPFEQPERSAASLEAIGKGLSQRFGERPMIVPSSDTNIMFLLDHSERLSPYFRTMGSADFDRFRLDAVHKGRCSEILERAGVDLPVTLSCDRASQIPHVARSVPYPCIYKPAVKDYGQTFYRLHGGLKAVECQTPAELRERLQRELASGFDLVVQEKLVFDRVSDEIPVYVYADRDHRIRMACCGVKEQLEHPPYGTATVLRLSWQDEVLPLAQRVVDALGWRGILMIEFTRTERGDLKLIEINCRPWLFVDFYRRCGFNYLGYLAEDLADRSDGWPELRVPSAELLSESPVHIDLPAALRVHYGALGPELDTTHVREWLESIPGRRSLTYLDPADAEPGRRELAALAQTLAVPATRLEAVVTPLLSGD